MELKITEKKESPLLDRIELKGTITFDKATPSNEELKKHLADYQKTKPELVAVKHIYTGYGKSKAEILAYVYHSKESFDKIEPKIKKKQAKAAAPEKKGE